MPCFRHLVLFYLLAMLLLTTLANAQQVKLIANPDVQTDVLSADEVKDIFLGKKTHWDNGAKITFFILKETRTHKAFLKSYLGQSASQYKRVWRRYVFSGRGKAPKSTDSDQEMVTLVSETSGGIGYVSTEANTGKLKILSVK